MHTSMHGVIIADMIPLIRFVNIGNAKVQAAVHQVSLRTTDLPHSSYVVTEAGYIFRWSLCPGTQGW